MSGAGDDGRINGTGGVNGEVCGLGIPGSLSKASVARNDGAERGLCASGGAARVVVGRSVGSVWP